RGYGSSRSEHDSDRHRTTQRRKSGSFGNYLMPMQRIDVIQFTCLICVAAVSGELEINALLDTCPITAVQGFISVDATDDLFLPLDSLSPINHRMHVRTNPPWIVQSSGN